MRIQPVATKQAYAIRAVNARERIFKQLRTLFPDADMPSIPTTSKFGQPHLHAVQWEVLADWFDGRVVSNEPDKSDEELNSYDTLTRAELEALIADRGLTDKVVPTGANGKAVKSDYLQALMDADADGDQPPVMSGGDEGTDNDIDGKSDRED
jgi:hypothetical protein